MDTFQSKISFSLQQDTNINALRFITKTLLAADLSVGQTIDWHSQHIVLPLYQPLQLQAGQTLEVDFTYRPGDPIETLQNGINVNYFLGQFRH